MAVAGVKGLRLPPRSPNWNAFAERWVRSVKEECLSHLILFGERSLRRALIQFQEHYHEERNHQGKSNVLLFPAPAPLEPGRRRGIRCRERLGRGAHWSGHATRRMGRDRGLTSRLIGLPRSAPPGFRCLHRDAVRRSSSRTVPRKRRALVTVRLQNTDASVAGLHNSVLTTHNPPQPAIRWF